MKTLHQILVDFSKRDVKRYLDQADEYYNQLMEFFEIVEEKPPKLEGARILLLMRGTPRCLYASLFAFRLAQQFHAELYVIHKGVLAPLVIDQAAELQIPISIKREVETLRLDEIKQFVEEHSIDLIVASGGMPLAPRLLSQLSIPIFFTKHPIYSKR